MLAKLIIYVIPLSVSILPPNLPHNPPNNAIYYMHYYFVCNAIQNKINIATSAYNSKCHTDIFIQKFTPSCDNASLKNILRPHHMIHCLSPYQHQIHHAMHHIIHNMIYILFVMPFQLNSIDTSPNNRYPIEIYSHPHIIQGEPTHVNARTLNKKF